MKRALILGVNGQDGSYLADHLIARGYQTIGVARQIRPVKNVALQISKTNLLQYRNIDVSGKDSLDSVFREFRPTSIFHVAALHGSDGFEYETKWQDALSVNTGSLHQCLEYARHSSEAVAIVYASSCKVFKQPFKGELSEASSIEASCLYGITKIAAQSLVQYYRREHEIQASIVYLFNHESPRRDSSYFIPTVVSALASAIDQKSRLTTLKTLDFVCNWGCASEYMDIIVDIAQSPVNTDFVLGHSKTWRGDEFLDALFSSQSLKFRDYFKILEAQNSKTPPIFSVSTKKLQTLIGRQPMRTVFDICDDMLYQNHRCLSLEG